MLQIQDCDYEWNNVISVHLAGTVSIFFFHFFCIRIILNWNSVSIPLSILHIFKNG